MNIFGSMLCYICDEELKDFLILPCGHSICGDCFEANKSIASHLISISCKCGLMTNLPKQKNISPRSSQCSANLNFTLSTLNHKTPHSKKAQSLILDATSLRIPQSYSKINKNSSQANFATKQITKSVQFLSTELNNELKFIQIKFDRYLNESSRNFNRLMTSMRNAFVEFKNDVRTRCEQEIAKMKITNIRDISRNLGNAFKLRIEAPLVNLTETLNRFSSQISTLETFPSITDKQNALKVNEQNKKKSQPKKKRTFSNSHINFGHHQCKISSDTLLKYDKFSKQNRQNPFVLNSDPSVMNKIKKKSENGIKKSGRLIKGRF